jgi:hypothetical protein
MNYDKEFAGAWDFLMKNYGGPVTKDELQKPLADINQPTRSPSIWSRKNDNTRRI